MQNKSRKKNQENSWERVKSWSQSRIAAQTLKITIDRTQRTALQPDVLQFPHPWTDTRWCCRGDSHVCSPCTNVCLRGQRLLSLVAASGHLSFAVPKSQVTPQPYPTHWPRWAGVREGSLWVLCRATTISFCQSHFKARFSQVHVSSSEDPVE